MSQAIYVDRNDNLEIDPSDSEPGNIEDKKAWARRAILRTLQYYPDIQVSMLGSHIRPYWPSWRQVLEEMVLNGEVVREARIQQTDRGSRVAFIHRLAH